MSLRRSDDDIRRDKERIVFLGWNDVVGDVPDTCTTDSARNSDVQLSAVGHCDALHFSCCGTDNLVELLIASVPPDDIDDNVGDNNGLQQTINDSNFLALNVNNLWRIVFDECQDGIRQHRLDDRSSR